MNDPGQNNEANPFHTLLCCPDCGSNIDLGTSQTKILCEVCSREFEFNYGILNCLPSNVVAQVIKDKERAGWQDVFPGEIEDVREEYLKFPYIQEGNGGEFYENAARQLEIVIKLIGNMEGKHGLDLGGSFGWAANQFVQRNAVMTLADYNDSTPSGLGGAQVYLDAGAQFDRVRVDAEALPFRSDQFDFVFCCSFLHHLVKPEIAIQHIGRVLRPGGTFYAIMEAFCPFWSDRKSALSRAHNIEHYTDNGINEQVFYQKEYDRWFDAAGLQCEIINPRWDDISEDGILQKNRSLRDIDYKPESLTNRQNSKSVIGLMSRSALKYDLWRIGAHPLMLKYLRGPLLSGSQKLRILVGKKVV